MNEIIPTVVPKSLADIEAAHARYGSMAHTLHVDATDGDFAFPTTWMPSEGDALPAWSGVWEVHVMVHDPRAAGEAFARAGAWRIIAHVEALGSAEDARNSFALWRLAGAREAVAALLIDTPIDTLEPIAEEINAIHLMSIVHIGAQGQELDERVYDRIAEAKQRFPHLPIAIDGGVNESNIAALVAAGATRLCVGAALARVADPRAAYDALAHAAHAVQ